MPTFTPNYNLGYFTTGDKYYSTIDQSRFTTIDNELAFLSDIVGDGVISGWNILDGGSTFGIFDLDINNEFTLTVNAGTGIIERYYTRSFGDLTAKLKQNQTYYIYMQRKRNYLASFSPFSDISTINYTDSNAPSTPINFSIDSFEYNNIVLGWDSNTEPDFYRYIIKRSTDDISFSIIGYSETNSYTDITVSENVLYYYRIQTQDLTGNISAETTSVSTNTGLNLTVPENPSDVFISSGNEFAQVVWRPKTINTISSYNIKTYLLDSEEVPGLVPVDNQTVLSTVFNVIIPNLTNGNKYRVEVYSVSPNSVYSSGVVLTALPVINSGPPEISSLTITQSQDINNLNGIALQIDFNYSTDNYFSDAKNFILTISNGIITSNSITITNDGSGIFSYTLTNFISGATTYNINSRTNYRIKVQGLSVSNNYNIGIYQNIYTNNYVNPKTPTNINIQQNSNFGLTFVWENSISKFTNNYITISKTDLTTNITTIIENNTAYGSVNSYIIDKPLSSNNRYDISIYCVDEFNLISDIVTKSYTTKDISGITIDPPLRQFILAGNKEVVLGWEDKYPKETTSFKIFRGETTNGIISDVSSYVLVDTIDSENSKIQYYTDYSVKNNTEYYYYISCNDIYGRHSLNPVEDGKSPVILLRAYTHPNVDNTFNNPITINTLISGYDVIVSWNSDNDVFDGYEIYRSKNDKNNWEKIGYTDKSVLSYTDTNVLIETDSYYYMVRKFRNESRLVITSTLSNPVDSVLLGKVITDTDSYYSEDLSTRISNYEYLLENYLSGIIENHNHQSDLLSDRRIDLSQNIRITEWTTTDNRLFETTESFSGAIAYRVYIDDVLTNIYYEINTTDKTIVFSNDISSSSTISLECVGLTETSGQLLEEKLQNISATLCYSGVLNKNSIKTIDHNGIFEQLIPLKKPLTSENDFIYEIYENSDTDINTTFGNSITFYDVDKLYNLKNSAVLNYLNIVGLTEYDITDYSYTYNNPNLIFDTGLVAVTSNGIMVSFNDGVTWGKAFSTSPIFKIYYSSAKNLYFALGNSIYYSFDGVSWAKGEGVDDANIIRDICENGNYFIISTDIGVYYLNDVSTNIFIFQKTTDISYKTSNCYGIYYDTILSRIVVSTDIGLFESYNYGTTWNYTSEFSEWIPIFNFVIEGTYVFGLTNNYLWRKTGVGDFIKIGYINSYKSRNLASFYDGSTLKLSINTDNGLLFTIGNIETDSFIAFNKDIPEINKTWPITDATSFDYIDGYLYIGSDNKFFKGQYSYNIVKIYPSMDTSNYQYPIIPSFYFDNNRQVVGFYYNNDTNTVLFDERVNENIIVSFSENYNMYRLYSGEWLHKNYSSTCKIYHNFNNFSNFNISSPLIVYTGLSANPIPEMTETEINVSAANIYINEYNTELQRLGDIISGTQSFDTGETYLSIISNICELYYKIYSKTLKPIKYFILKTIGLTDYTIIDSLLIPSSLASTYYSDYELVPQIPEVLLDTETILNYDENSINSVDISSGIVQFLYDYNKYDVLSLEIPRTSLYNDGIHSHKELEDNIEIYNSGLPLGLSNIFQSNLMNTELYIEKNYPNERTSLDVCGLEINSTINSKYIIPRNKTFYDNLNSTINYKSEDINFVPGITIDYLTDAEYFSAENKIYIGTFTNLYSINKTTLEISKINYNQFQEYVKDVFVLNSVLYVLTERNLYQLENLTWSKLETNGIDGIFGKILVYNNIFLISSTKGLYYKTSYDISWIKVADYININYMYYSSFAFIVNNNKLYYSNNGTDWIYSGDFGDIKVNSFVKYKINMAVASNSGLRYDNTTFYSNNAQLSLVDLAANIITSETLEINDVVTNGTTLIAGMSDGNYYTILGSTFNLIPTNLETIKKVIYVDNDIWCFSNDKVQISSYTYPIKLSSGSIL